ncbi:MAG: hypothetical protein IT453_05540 [Planctomycetes bacterium]|nr:hypothetical protein [Planctomycetota bacterium]
MTTLDAQHGSRLPFGRQAIAFGYLTEAQASALLREQSQHGLPLGEILVRRGVFDRRTLSRALREYLLALGREADASKLPA